jgi:DNA repair photolyase
MRHRIRPLSEAEREALRPNLRETVTYRKSGLSLNHIIGCPLDCAYCIRHKDDNFGMKQPHALMTDEAAVTHLVQHRYFQRDITPLQIFNKATDGFLPAVRPHLFRTLELLDGLGLQNHVIVITRYIVDAEACRLLNQFKNIKITLFITYSGIEDPRIEPITNDIPKESLRVSFAEAERYRVVLYWRPIVPGLNDSEQHLTDAFNLSQYAHSTVFTGLFYNAAVREYFDACGLPKLYDETARRKIFPEELERRILARARGTPAEGKLFRKTSCGLAFAHKTRDYNGHYGISEICDICPNCQVQRCAAAFVQPTEQEVRKNLRRISADGAPFEIKSRAVEIVGLDEEPRYFMQHTLGFQFHDKKYPHHFRRHGRADIGWADLND